MTLNSIGYNFCHNADFKISRPNGLNEYLLLIIRSKAVFEFSDKIMHTKPNSMIIFKKRTPQHFGADGETYVNDWLSFTLNPAEEKLLLNSSIVLDKIIESSEVAVCSDIIKLMQEEWHSDKNYKDETLELFCKIIYTKIKGVFLCKKNDKAYYNDFVKMRASIYSNPSIKYTVECLADRLHLSKSYFQHLYKEYFQISPMSDVIKSRMEFSKQLLCSNNYSVKEISQILGYNNDTQFMKQFKKATGVTPSEYKKIIMESLE